MNLPINDNFFMPAEFAKHYATIMIWPHREGSWPYKAEKAKSVFENIINAISNYEKVVLLANEKTFENAKNIFINNKNVQVLKIENDDAWARDTAPTFVINKSGDVKGIDWNFNAWGGDFDGLYKDFENDNKIPQEICKQLNIKTYNANHFTLEGGSIHTDGEGTLLTTKECLLSKGRNPHMSIEEIENNLKNYLNVEKIIWLESGISGDETNGHIDNICAFINPAEVVLAWTDDVNDPQHEISKKCLDVLENTVDAKGRKIKVHKLPIPKVPVTIKENDLKGYVFEDGEDQREVGERLAASYVNFYFCNNAIILPQFDDEHDKIAVKTLKTLCPNRDIVTIYARDIIVGGGNIHCLTQQIPFYNA